MITRAEHPVHGPEWRIEVPVTVRTRRVYDYVTDDWIHRRLKLFVCFGRTKYCRGFHLRAAIQ